MQFFTAFTSFLVASTVVASPVAQPPALVGRQIDVCIHGIPCIIQDQLNDCFNDVNMAYALVKVVAHQHIDDARLSEITARLNAAIPAITDAAVRVKAQVVDTKVELVHDTVNDVVSDIKAGAAALQADTLKDSQGASILALVNQIVGAAVDIEAIVGYCKRTTGSTPTLGPVSDVSSAVASPTATPSTF